MDERRAPWPIHAALLAGVVILVGLAIWAEPADWRGGLLVGALMAGMVLWRWWSESSARS